MFSRLTAFVLAVFVTASAVAQVGCGVLHCVAPPTAAATAAKDTTPSCHSPAAPTVGHEGTPAREGDDGKGACCISHPAEAAGAGAGSSVATVEVQVLVLDVVSVALPLERRPLASPAFRETGPPGWVTGATRLPLRV